MRIYYSGSEPKVCGNGIRCPAGFMAASGRQEGAAEYTVHTLAGLMRLALEEEGQVSACMPAPGLAGHGQH